MILLARITTGRSRYIIVHVYVVDSRKKSNESKHILSESIITSSGVMGNYSWSSASRKANPDHYFYQGRPISESAKGLVRRNT
jgi:hypothetical protein